MRSRINISSVIIQWKFCTGQLPQFAVLGGGFLTLSYSPGVTRSHKVIFYEFMDLFAPNE